MRPTDSRPSGKVDGPSPGWAAGGDFEQGGGSLAAVAALDGTADTDLPAVTGSLTTRRAVGFPTLFQVIPA